jgi:hypothetical protein
MTITKETLLSLNPKIIPTMEMFLKYLEAAKSFYPEWFFNETCAEPSNESYAEAYDLGSKLIVRKTTAVKDLYTSLVKELRECSLQEKFKSDHGTTLVRSKAGTFLFHSDKDVTDYVKFCIPKLVKDTTDRLKISVCGRGSNNAEIFPSCDPTCLAYDHYREEGGGVSHSLKKELPLDRIDELPGVLDSIRKNVLYKP